jgi:Flp pilus assembly protein TadD
VWSLRQKRLLAVGREVEAEAEFRQILELDENFTPARLNMIMIHALRGELAEALAIAENRLYSHAKDRQSELRVNAICTSTSLC